MKGNLKILLSILIAAALLLLLAWPRMNVITDSLEALPDEVLRQQLESASHSELGESAIFGELTIVSRSNLLGWEETVYLLPTVQMDAGSISPGGTQTNTVSLRLITLRSEGNSGIIGALENISLTLKPGNEVSVRGNTELTTYSGGIAELTRTGQTDCYMEKGPVAGLDLTYRIGIADSSHISGQINDQAEASFQFDLTYDGVTVAKEQTLTAVSMFTLVP